MLLCCTTYYAMEEKTLTSKKVDYIRSTYDDICSKKATQPLEYFSQTNTLLNAIYTRTLLYDPLADLRQKYTICNQLKESVCYQGIHINGAVYTRFVEQLPDDTFTMSPSGKLFKIVTPDKRTEWSIYASSPNERAFVKKITFLNDNSLLNTDKLLDFLSRYQQTSDPQIKILINNYTYLTMYTAMMKTAVKINLINNILNNTQSKKYLSPYNILLAQEKLLYSLTKCTLDASGEDSFSVLKAFTPVCTASIFDSLDNENPLLLDIYKTIIADVQNTYIQHIKTENFQASECLAFQEKYLSIATELKPIFSTQGLYNELPGIELSKIEKPVKPYQKQQKAAISKKRARSRAQAKKPTQALSNSNTKPVPVEAPSTSIELTTNNRAKASPQETLEIIYDPRVLEKNANKKDYYHGFTLMAIPFVLKYGTRKTWVNKKNQHNDDLFELYGEIKYHDTKELQFIKCAACKGADGAIYHIGMNKGQLDKNNNLHYEINYPQLSTKTTKRRIAKASDCDEYGSYIITMNEYMVQLYDGGLNATITFYI